MSFVCMCPNVRTCPRAGNTRRGMGVRALAAYAHGVTTTGTEPEFARELRRWRNARRISQLERAIRAGTTQRHVSYVEQARSPPGPPTPLRLAHAPPPPSPERRHL